MMKTQNQDENKQLKCKVGVLEAKVESLQLQLNEFIKFVMERIEESKQEIKEVEVLEEYGFQTPLTTTAPFKTPTAPKRPRMRNVKSAKKRTSKVAGNKTPPSTKG